MITLFQRAMPTRSSDTINFFHAVWKCWQSFPRYDDIIVICLLNRTCKIRVFTPPDKPIGGILPKTGLSMIPLSMTVDLSTSLATIVPSFSLQNKMQKALGLHYRSQELLSALSYQILFPGRLNRSLCSSQNYRAFGITTHRGFQFFS